jgi:DNA-binding response OmpR family regulator
MKTPNVIALLLVDDDPNYRNIVEHVLSTQQEEQFRIVWKTDGPSALEELERNPGIDLILLDYHLPGLNGLELVREIRERQINCPIVFVTADRDARIAIEAVKYRVEDYFIKGEVTNSTLAKTLIRILEHAAFRKKIARNEKAEFLAKGKNDAVKELIVTVCHEFNNPLAAMKISADILARQQLSPHEKNLLAELDKNIRLIEAEITRLRESES